MRTPLIALTALTILASAPASASDFIVKHADLDLSTAKGQKALDRRIDAEARRYCGMNSQQTGTRVTARSASECFAQARAAARAQVASLIEKSTLKGG